VGVDAEGRGRAIHPRRLGVRKVGAELQGSEKSLFKRDVMLRGKTPSNIHPSRGDHERGPLTYSGKSDSVSDSSAGEKGCLRIKKGGYPQGG